MSGKLLKALDDLGIANDTIVVYTTDNGPHMNSWPDGGYTPFRNEKNTNWEGAFRVPAFVRWPGHIPAGQRVERDLLGPRLVPDPARRGRRHRRQGTPAHGLATAGRRAHLQGASRRLQPASLPDGAAGQSRRARSSSTSTTMASSSRCATRTGSWCSASSATQGTLQIWREPFTCLRAPKMYNLRMDPYERADITSNTYNDWIFKLLVPGRAGAGAGGAVHRHLQGIPAAADAVELQRRSDHGDAEEAAGRLTARVALRRRRACRADRYLTNHVGFRCVKRTRAAE